MFSFKLRVHLVYLILPGFVFTVRALVRLQVHYERLPHKSSAGISIGDT